jgi:hypothetical protein
MFAAPRIDGAVQMLGKLNIVTNSFREGAVKNAQLRIEIWN